MAHCLFVSDLHGRVSRYAELLKVVEDERPKAVFMGGDLFPSPFLPGKDPGAPQGDFLITYLIPLLRTLQARLSGDYPEIFLIPGNDDPRDAEDTLEEGAAEGLWRYAHLRCHALGAYTVYGYACVPPTPFLWKDWERYDVSRYVPPGCVSPEEGWRTVDASLHDTRYGTIRGDLEEMVGAADLSNAVLLFHTPPADTTLDRAALDGKMVDHVPLDVHVGSIAVRRFIESRQPLLTLHGHIHESARITGSWRDRIGRTHLFSAAHDGPELSLIRFDLNAPEDASRELI